MSEKVFKNDFVEIMQEREGIMSSTIEDAFNDSEEWRAQCEARHCLDFYDLDERRRYLSLVEIKRGLPGRKLLEENILKEWNRRKAA